MKTYSALTEMGTLLLFVVMANTANADVLSLAPSQALSFSSAEDQKAYVAVQFDLSDMRSGPGRSMDEALLEWTVTGVPSSRHSEFSIFPIIDSWNLSAVRDGAAEIISGSTVLSAWDISPREHEGGLGGLVRLDLTDLVSGWADGTANNHGVLLMTADVSSSELSEQLSAIRLIVRYGFVKSD